MRMQDVNSNSVRKRPAMFQHTLRAQVVFLIFLLVSAEGCSLKDTIQGAIGASSSPTPTSPFKITTDIGTNSDDWGTAMAVQSDGKILLAGGSDAGNPGNSYDFVLMRILATGQ